MSQLQTISGLGGIGKTQTAIEYAYRFQNDYSAVLFLQGDNKQAVLSGCMEITRLLSLPMTDDERSDGAVKAVRRWLDEHERWLLIIDNADSSRTVHPLLPRPNRGHIILTSRNPNWAAIGPTESITLDQMTHADSLQLLLRRTGRKDCAGEEAVALEDIVRELGYLPLALEQAGAYIEETDARFSSYLVDFRKRRLALLQEKPALGGYSHSVATTWAMNLEEVRRTSHGSADLMNVCALLAPDMIPEELFLAGAQDLGQELAALAESEEALDQLLGPLRRYSLILRRRDQRTFNIHRLVQEVIRAEMSLEERAEWVRRIVCALLRVFPMPGYEGWQQCERLLAHALAVVLLVGQHELVDDQVRCLLERLGAYLCHRGSDSAEPFLSRALSIAHQIHGTDSREAVSAMALLAVVYIYQGQYAKAQALLIHSLSIAERERQPDHEQVATILGNIALSYKYQGHYHDALLGYTKALRTLEKVRGPDDPELASLLHNLASLYRDLEQPKQARPLLERALRILENQLQPGDPAIGHALTNLGSVLEMEEKRGEARQVHERALELFERAYGAEHSSVALALNNLAVVAKEQGYYGKARRLHERALAIRTKLLGLEHRDTAMSLYNLAHLAQAQGKVTEAKSLLERALTIFEQVLGPEHLYVAWALSGLLVVSQRSGDFEQDEQLLRRILSIQEKVLGRNSSEVAKTLLHLGLVLDLLGQPSEAEPMLARCLTIMEQTPGPPPSDRESARQALTRVRAQQAQRPRARR